MSSAESVLHRPADSAASAANGRPRWLAPSWSPPTSTPLTGAWSPRTAPAYLGSTVAEIQAAGFPVVPWTVNSKRRMKKMLDLGVDGLITDYPDVLLALLEERGIAVR